MTDRNTPTHIDDPGDLAIGISGYTIGLGTGKHGCAMHLPSHVARWLAKELEMMAAEVDRKQAKAMVSNAREVMK